MPKTKSTLRLIKRLLDKTLGTKADELYWHFRHFLNKNWAKSYISESAINHPSRQLLIQAITKHIPLKSVLEIGCASGPNLYLLSKKLPSTKLYGIDISKKATEFGTDWFNKKGITNVVLSYGKADNLNSFSDKSVDVVFTDATLIYIGPDKIDAVVKEMMRVARKAIVLIERLSEENYSYQLDHWAYNWENLFNKYDEVEKYSLTKITDEIWSGDWAHNGYLIEVSIKTI